MSDIPWKPTIISSVILGMFIFLFTLLPTVPEAVEGARRACKNHDAVKSFDADNNVVVCRDGSIFYL
jgi:hypothetical protein